jgi:hypothetical protein
MPAMLDSTDYASFDFKHFDEKPLTLEEASRQAVAKRREHSGNVYRVVPVDPEMSGFRVESVPLEDVYAGFRVRIAERWARLLRRQR